MSKKPRIPKKHQTHFFLQFLTFLCNLKFIVQIVISLGGQREQQHVTWLRSGTTKSF